MKAPTPKAGNFNTLSFAGISLLWGHMLGLISPWFIPLTVLLLVAGYGSELKTRL